MKRFRFLMVAVLLCLATISCKKDSYTATIELTQSTACTQGYANADTKTTITFTGTEDEIDEYVKSMNTTVSSTAGGITCSTTTTAVVLSKN